MKLAISSAIRKIDQFAISNLGIPAEILMQRSGRAVADAVRTLAKSDSHILIFAGKGNNGGDGYAAACELLSEYKITVYDVFSSGQKSPEGIHFYESFKSMGGQILSLDRSCKIDISENDIAVDAIFGTGFSGEVPDNIKSLVSVINSSGASVIAVDVPAGINADNGSVNENPLKCDITVSLSYMKPGLLSYPALEYTGEIILNTLDLPSDRVEAAIPFNNYFFDFDMARESLPPRLDNSNKGSFGKVLLITGGDTFAGAGLLTLEAALRGGAGYVTHITSEKNKALYISTYPEVIYNTDDKDIAKISAVSKKSSATLIGSGSGVSEALADLTCSLLKSEGSPLIIDADAINSIAKYKSKQILKESRRKIILTPHPLEFSRICGKTVEEISENRISSAKAFAMEYNCILILKGARTITTDGERLYINSSGSSALAKAGSGDVLAGLLASICAYHTDPAIAAALAVYLHGLAGDRLAKDLSRYGVTPSDLPHEIAKIMCEIERTEKQEITTKM